jgi:type I restriction enzyme R subunit
MAPGDDKKDFRVFDFCFNFDFFNENPDGIEGSGGVPLGTRLFQSRVQLLGHLQSLANTQGEGKLLESVTDQLFGEVAAMNQDNFIVRMHLEPVEKFQKREAWGKLSEGDRNLLSTEVAGLPSELETDEIESRLFDLLALKMQLAHVEETPNIFEASRQRVVDLAMLLEEKSTVPAVRAQLEYLARLQEPGFWENIDLPSLEDMRLRLRGLLPLLEKQSRKIVYTDFKDEIGAITDIEVLDMPRMTGAQYEKKLKEYLKNHLDDEVIKRLRTNERLSADDLERLEEILISIGENDGQELLKGLLDRVEAPSLPYFVKSLVGMDRAAAQATFSEYLADRSLTPQQMRFVEMVIDQLTSRGVIEAASLYEAPFSNLHAGGPDELFAGHDSVIEGIFEKLRQVKNAVVGLAG